MSATIWMNLEDVLAIHDMLLARHGGAEGVHSENLQLAILQPRRMAGGGKKRATLARLAATYALGLTAKPVFASSNSRTALVMALTFLELNGIVIQAPEEDVYLIFWALLEARTRSEARRAEALERWLIQHSVARKHS